MLRVNAFDTIRRLFYGFDCWPYKDEIIYINPREIVGKVDPKCMRRFKIKAFCNNSSVTADVLTRKLKYVDIYHTGFYQSLYMHFVEGSQWSDTPTYKALLKKIKDGNPSHDAPDESQLNTRYKRIDIIFKDIVKKQWMSENKKDLVMISIAEDGSFFWGPDGRHRVAMALIAGLDLMPARVGFIHPSAIETFKKVRTHRVAE